MLLKEDERKAKEKILTKYFIQQLHGHNSWSFKFVFCEILNFINVRDISTIFASWAGIEITHSLVLVSNTGQYGTLEELYCQW